MQKKLQKVAVIGAGVAGLSLASRLLKAGLDVQVFEKSRGVGGRLASRRIEGIGSFDLGAQFMTAESELFGDVLAAARGRGSVASWDAKLVHMSDAGVEVATPRQRFVGVPSMNAWIKDIFPTQAIAFERTVKHIQYVSDGAWVLNEDQATSYDALVLAVPAPQARALVESHATRLPAFMMEALQQEPMTPCWCVYLAFEKRLDVPFDGAFVRLSHSPFNWVARNSAKPDRATKGDLWVLHASPEWSRAHLEQPASEVEKALWEAFAQLAQVSLPQPTIISSHRWRYAAPMAVTARRPLWDKSQSLGIVGDWVVGGRVEGAYMAGAALADSILGL